MAKRTINNSRPTISVDFDGVLHSYTSGWQGLTNIPDRPVLGAIVWLHTMIQDYDVEVLSTRGHSWFGRRAMRAWLKKHAGMLWVESPTPGLLHGLEEVKFVSRKGKCWIYLDDRARRFNGPDTWPSIAEIEAFKPWNKQDKK